MERTVRGSEVVNAATLEADAQRLAGRAPAEVLAWAGERLAPLTFATGFGPEGCVLIDVIARNRLPVDLFTLDTGLLFAETRELWQQLESRYGVTIRSVRPAQTVEEQARTFGDRLWEHAPDRCCELRKVRPLRAALAGFRAWVSAIRRDQTGDRASARVLEWDESFGLAKVNPLVAWSAEEVWSYVREHRVPVNVLHEGGYPSIGCVPCTSPVRPGEDPRAGRWRGRGKTECGLHVRSRTRS